MKWIEKHALFLCIVIVIMGFCIRVWDVGNIPSGFHRDEAAFGYNAYSILKTGRDMSGATLPLHFSSFLYSPALYSYAAIPSIAFFGLTPFAVRLPSVLFGTLTILLMYFLVKKLFSHGQNASHADYPMSNVIALFSALFLAFNPWHIILSRTATENVVVVFFLLASLIAFFSYVKTRMIVYLFASYIGFLIMMGLYQAPRAFLPIFIPFLTLLYWKQLGKRGNIINVMLYSFCILLPLILILMSPDLSTRMSMLSVFGSKETVLVNEEQVKEDTAVFPRFVSRIFHNKLIGYGGEIRRNYINHFSYDFLFTDNVLPARYRVVGSGILYLIDLPLLLLGLYVCVRNRKTIHLFLLGWILITPIGSSIAFDDVPNMQRTLMMVPPIAIIWALGVVKLFEFLRSYKRAAKWSIYIILGGVFGFSIIQFSHQYFIHINVHHPRMRQEGYKELVQTINKELPNYRSVVISDSESAPTIFFLFFGKYDPKTFQEETKGKIVTFDRTNFGSYVFSKEPCPLRLANEASSSQLSEASPLRTLPSYTGNPYDLFVNLGDCTVPKEAEVIQTIKRLDGSTVFQVLRSN